MKLSKPLPNLTPAIIQDYTTGEIIMLGYMNQQALQKTMKEGIVYFFSRSRKRLWKKGETSGNTLLVEKIFLDCDGDAILIMVSRNDKAVCHRGRNSCFFKQIV